jgi:hypothetical protein
MAKANRTRNRSKKNVQKIWSEPRKVFIERYLSPKGVKLLAKKEISKEEAWEKYGKNRYKINRNAKLLYTIVHEL